MKTANDIRSYFKDMEEHEIGLALYDFTQRTTVIEDLTQAEIDLISKFYEFRNKTPEEIYRYNNRLKEWRSNVLALATEAGIKEPTSFQKFNNWMLRYSIEKKPLNQHSIEELEALYKQIKALMRSNALSATKPMTKAWYGKGDNLKDLN